MELFSERVLRVEYRKSLDLESIVRDGILWKHS